MFRLIPREERFFDLFEEQGRNIVAGAERLREMVFDFSDAPRQGHGDQGARARRATSLTHELIRKINTTFITPFDREDVYALASRLDDVLDLIEAAADRLVLYRIKEPTSGCPGLRRGDRQDGGLGAGGRGAASARRARATTSTASR